MKTLFACIAAASLTVLTTGAAAASAVAFVDLADAYERADALKGLIPQLDTAMAKIRTDFEAQREPLVQEIEALKTSRMHEEARMTRKRELLLKLAALEQATAKRQQAVGKANEQATARVDAEVLRIQAELSKGLGLEALFPTQDLLYFKPDSPLNLSGELYKRLNQSLPKVELQLPAGS